MITNVRQPQKVKRSGSHVFILIREMRPGGLVEGDDHGHQVFAVEDGRGQDVPGLVISELIHK